MDAFTITDLDKLKDELTKSYAKMKSAVEELRGILSELSSEPEKLALLEDPLTKTIQSFENLIKLGYGNLSDIDELKNRLSLFNATMGSYATRLSKLKTRLQ